MMLCMISLVEHGVRYTSKIVLQSLSALTYEMESAVLISFRVRAFCKNGCNSEGA
jgi:hypothetical protein